MPRNYRDNLIEGIQNLFEAEQILFTGALNLAWSGELSHLEDAYEAGDEVTFDYALLESVEDANVKEIVALLLPLQRATEYLINVNKISDEDFQSAEND